MGNPQLDKLQPGQLCCPQLSSLLFQYYDTSQVAHAGEVGRQCCSLTHLPRLATLQLLWFYCQATLMDLGLPASLKHLTARATLGVDLKWMLLEAVQGIRSGAQLQTLMCTDCMPSSHPEGMPWGASSVARYRELGQQLRGLRDLTLYGSAPTLLSAIGAVVGSAPDLTRLEFRVEKELEDYELPPICSASLKSLTGRFQLKSHNVRPPPVILTFLSGCTELRDVHVQFHNSRYAAHNMPKEGTCVRIRCHCTSQRCIMPLDACAGLEEVGVRFLPMPPSSQGVQAHTITFICHTAGPEQALVWDHVVLPGVR